MTFPPVTEWHMISRAVGAIYESVDDYSGYDSVVGDLKVEAHDDRIDIVWHGNDE